MTGKTEIEIKMMISYSVSLSFPITVLKER